MADTRKAELIAELSRARGGVSAHARAMRRDVEIGPKIRMGFRRNRTAWLGSAACIGLLFSKIPARTKKVPAVEIKRADKEKMKTAGKAGVMFAVLKLALDLAKPSMVTWVTSRISGASAGAKAGRKAGGLA